MGLKSFPLKTNREADVVVAFQTNKFHGSKLIVVFLCIVRKDNWVSRQEEKCGE
jgi:hypothetical protein